MPGVITKAKITKGAIEVALLRTKPHKEKIPIVETVAAKPIAATDKPKPAFRRVRTSAMRSAITLTGRILERSVVDASENAAIIGAPPVTRISKDGNVSLKSFLSKAMSFIIR